MKFKQLLFAAIISLISYSVANADEELLSYRLSTTNGLPNNNIREMYLGKTGIIYFKAKYNTYAFDGYSFRQVDFNKCEDDFETARYKNVQKDNSHKTWKQDNMGNYYRMDNEGVIHITDYKTKE